MTCWLFHKWGKWGEIEKGSLESTRPVFDDYYSKLLKQPDGYKTETIPWHYQRRRCERCNKVQLKEVSIK